MDSMRIQMRLYLNRPDDAIVIDWINSLPRAKGGKRHVKTHIVNILAEALREKRSVEKQTPMMRNGAERKSGSKIDKPADAADPVKELNVDELPEFPDVSVIEF